jgi:hypothetical protein
MKGFGRDLPATSGGCSVRDSTLSMLGSHTELAPLEKFHFRARIVSSGYCLLWAASPEKRHMEK